MDTFSEALTELEPEIRQKYGRKMRCIAPRCDLDDLVQAIYLKAWKHRRTCRGASTKAIQGWLRVVAANVFRSTMNQHLGCANRSMKREQAGEPLESSVQCDPSQSAEVAESKQLVRALVQKLTARQQLAVRMRYIQEQEYADVASAMGISEHRARVLASVGVRRLRAMDCQS